MKTIQRTTAALLAVVMLTFALPTLASPARRRDPAALDALTTISRMQTTLTAMQVLIDGIQTRKGQSNMPAPAVPAAPNGQ